MKRDERQLDLEVLILASLIEKDFGLDFDHPNNYKPLAAKYRVAPETVKSALSLLKQKGALK